MSGNKPYFIHHKAKKQSGEASAVFWESAKNEPRALRDADNALEDAGKDPANYFKAVVTNFPVVNELPEEGEINFTFCNFYQLGDDGMTWGQIPGVSLPAHPAEKSDENSDEIIVDGVNTETEEVIDGDEPSKELVDLTVFGKYSHGQKVFGTWLFGLLPEFSKEQLAEISDTELDQDQYYVQNVMLACRNVRQLEHVFPETRADLFAATKIIWPLDSKLPLLTDLIAFFTEWLDAHNNTSSIPGSGKEHLCQDVIEKWLKKFNKTAVQQPVVEGVAEPERYKRAVPQSTSGLRNEIAIALLYPDVVPGNVSRAKLTGAKDLQEREDPVFTTAAKTLVAISDILEYDTTTIFGVTLAVKWNSGLSVKDLRSQARAWLSEHGVYEDGTPSTGYAEWLDTPRDSRSEVKGPTREDVDQMMAEQRGDFVPGVSDPNDPKWDKTPGHSEPVKKVADGLYDVSAFFQDASNQGEKPEVETTSDVQIQETVSDEEQAGDEDDTGETGLGDGETPDAVVDGDVNQNQENASQNTDSVSHKEPESAEIEPVPQPEWPTHFEPGRYEGVPNEVYHAANGVSSTQIKDARISLMFYHGRHIAKTIPRQQSEALVFGNVTHGLVLEPKKFAEEFAIPAAMPESVVSTTADLVAIIKEYNASLPALMTPEELKAWIEAYNNDLIPPLSLSGDAEEIGMFYVSLPDKFRRLPEDEKHTVVKMKACIKEYNESLPPLLKVSGTRDQLLDQIATVAPKMAESERAKFIPYNTSGTKEVLTEIVRSIRPDVVISEDWHKQQEQSAAGKTTISLAMYEQAKNISDSLQADKDASWLINHPERQSEVSYFGFDEETGLEIRVRPDIEIRLPFEGICADLKTISIGYVRQDRIKDRLHREIIERDYHLSAAMYCDVAGLDSFSWIFVNKDPGYHWVAVVEASPMLLELGRKEYRRVLRQINDAMESNVWPAPISERYIDDLNDYDLRRLEALEAE